MEGQPVIFFQGNTVAKDEQAKHLNYTQPEASN